MIGFRQHVVTLVALFLALAVGIVLGGGPLSEVGTAVTPVRTAPATTAAPDARAAYADTFAGAVAPRAYANGLADRPVALVVLPGSDGAEVDALTAQVGAAGGSVIGRYDVADLLLDPGETSLVDTLGSQLAQQAQGTEVPADATAYDRIGALLGGAIATTKPTGTGLGADSTAIVESLAGAGLLTSGGIADQRAPLVLVVLGADPGPESDPILEGVLAGLAGTATGVVVAGAADGSLGRLRESASMAGVTSVDGTDGTAGQTTAVLALIRSLTTSGGAFGAAGADGAVPLG